MSHRWAVVAALAFLWLAGLTAHPLLESTEGRYASIAAAMVRSGDFLEPRFNGILHLEKPPLAYLAAAVSLRLLPDGEFAVRLPAALVWLLAAYLVFRTSRAAGLDVRRARWAAAFAALSPLAAFAGHLLGCDVFLWVGILVYQLAALHLITWAAAPANSALEEARRGACWLAGAGLGLGFMAKGHIVLVWTVLPALVAWVVVRRRVLWGPLGAGRTWIAFAVLGLPWFVIEALRHPGLLEYWLGHHTASRYLTTVHGRSEPWWYFPALLPAVVLPWLPECWRGLRQALQRTRVKEAAIVTGLDARMLFTLASAIVPFLFLCFSGSKRPNYLLPMLGPLACMAAAALPERRSALARAWSGTWVAFLLLVPWVLSHVPRAVPPTRDLVRSARQAGAPLVTFRVLPASAPYYWGDNLPAIEVPRERRFDDPAVLQRWAPQTTRALAEHLRAGGSVLCRAQDAGAAREAAAVPVVERAAAGGLVLLWLYQ